MSISTGVWPNPNRDHVTFSPNVCPDQVITIAPEHFSDKRRRYVLSSDLKTEHAQELASAIQERDRAQDALDAVVAGINERAVSRHAANHGHPGEQCKRETCYPGDRLVNGERWT